MAGSTSSSTMPAPTAWDRYVNNEQPLSPFPENTKKHGRSQMDAQDPRAFIRDVAVNLHGPYYLMRLLLPRFREQRSGCVLNMASRAGTVAMPYSTSYCASKAALIHLTACAQKEMDVEGLDDIHLYSLHPGGIKSAMTLKSGCMHPRVKNLNQSFFLLLRKP